MLLRLLDQRLVSITMVFQRSLIVRNDFQLSQEMKKFNDNKQYRKTIEIFHKNKQIHDIGKCSSYVISHLLKACTQLNDIELGLQIHREIKSRLNNDSFILFALIQLYMQNRAVIKAECLFNSTKNPPLQITGCMMKGYISNNQPMKAIHLFQKTEKPDEVLYILFFNACAKLGSNECLNLIKTALNDLPQSFYDNERLSTSLIDALIKCHDTATAVSILNSRTNPPVEMIGAIMKSYINDNQPIKAIGLFGKAKNPNHVLYILYFQACAQIGSNECLNLIKTALNDLPQSFHDNDRLLTSLIDALMECGDVEKAEHIFYSRSNQHIPMTGAMMKGYVSNNQLQKAIDLLNKMKTNGIQVNEMIYLHVIKALSKIGDYLLCQMILEDIPEKFLSIHNIQTALINMWGRCSAVDKAEEIFEKIIDRDHAAYSSMINVYGLNGMGVQALQLYKHMSQEFIDEVTHTCVLNACSHCGLIDEARSIFTNIPMKTEPIFVTMIDVLSRASLFKEAQNLIDEYEYDNSPSLIMYMSLLSGARNAKNSDLAQQTYERMKQLFPQSKDVLTSGLILLANVYGSIGDLEKANEVRKDLNESGLKKRPSASWTVTNGQIHEFRAHDQRHPRSSEIHSEAKKIAKELVQHGYRYDPSWVTRPLKEGESIGSVLCGHSERLAIAWNFVADSKATRIQITKNLRVCGDCHEATKWIAKIRQCEIIVRDANRIHHFQKDGQCSCNDYF